MIFASRLTFSPLKTSKLIQTSVRTKERSVEVFVYAFIWTMVAVAKGPEIDRAVAALY